MLGGDMYYLKIKEFFAAAHNLLNYNGKCEALHGHNWKIEATISGNKLDKAGMLIDFKILKEFLNEILDTLDHKYLNELDFFNGMSPSSEFIAKYIFEELEKKLKNTDANVFEVCAWESSTSCAIYRRQ
jgi:6-pyruvoyltetrahydropterin/6-carboxytetrahydropterin synthase